jgi:hypothetical protein
VCYGYDTNAFISNMYGDNILVGGGGVFRRPVLYGDFPRRIDASGPNSLRWPSCAALLAPPLRTAALPQLHLHPPLQACGGAMTADWRQRSGRIYAPHTVLYTNTVVTYNCLKMTVSIWQLGS